MDDKTLLLKAARAAGYGLNARGQSLREAEMPNEPSLWLTHATWWNPLTDSGQALDLAVKLEMDIGQMLTEGCVTVTGVAFEGEALTDFSGNVDDLVAAADALRKTGNAPTLLIGHSLGGAAVIAAAERIKKRYETRGPWDLMRPIPKGQVALLLEHLARRRGL